METHVITPHNLTNYKKKAQKDKKCKNTRIKNRGTIYAYANIKYEIQLNTKNRR